MIEVPKLVNGGKRKLVFLGFEPPTVMASESETERPYFFCFFFFFLGGGVGGVGGIQGHYYEIIKIQIRQP